MLFLRLSKLSRVNLALSEQVGKLTSGTTRLVEIDYGNGGQIKRLLLYTVLYNAEQSVKQSVEQNKTVPTFPAFIFYVLNP